MTNTVVSTTDRWVAGLLFLLAALFYIAVFRYAINVPHVDDYLYIDSIRQIFAPGTSLPEAIRLLVEQHNDHRILLSRLLVLADYWVEGQVNYRTLTLLGSLSIASLMWLVYRLFRQANVPAWLVLPVALFLFQPSYQEDVWWVLCLLQHTLTLLLMILIFQLLTRPERAAQVTALALGGLAIYSNSNGLFMWGAVLLLLALTRRWRWLVVWAATGGILIGLYFSVNYHFLAQNSLATVAKHPDWVVKSLVSFAGSALYFDQRRWLLLPSQWVVLGAGTLVLLVISISWLRAATRPVGKLSASILPFLGLGVVLLVSGLLAAFVRSDGGLMIVDRYQVFAVWCLIVTYALLVMQLTGGRQTVVGWVGLGLASWFWLNAWLFYGPQLGERYNRQVAEAFALKQYGYSVVSQPFGRDPHWQKRWDQAMKQGIYRVPELPELEAVNMAINGIPTLNSITRFATETRWVASMSADELLMVQDSLPKPDFLYLQSPENWYVMPAQQLPKPILKPWLPSRGVKSSVLPEMLKPGTYRIGWVRQNESGWAAMLTQQEIQILNRPGQ